MTIRVKLNRAGVRELLRSDAVGAKLSQDAKKAAPAHPDVTVGAPFKGRNRARVEIRTKTVPGQHALTKKFGGR